MGGERDEAIFLYPYGWAAGRRGAKVSFKVSLEFLKII
ncbi:hypothetical protein X926_02415 [Petrotoga sp. HWHPT.55.6.3]|nr:hypothetical protein X926_02415 [Petrotoga sp. HWHPT.55.6.3]